MARPAHPDQGRAGGNGPLIGAIAILLIVSFLPQRALSYLAAPGRVVRFVLYPVSDPVKKLTATLRPAAPRHDDPMVEQLKLQIEQFKTLYQQALATIADKQRLIENLQQGAAVAEGPVRQLHAAVIANSSSGIGGTFQVGAGDRYKVDRSTIASTDGVQYVGRVTAVEKRTCTVTLMTDKSAGSIGGAIFADDGTRLAQMPLLSPVRGQRALSGQVLYSTPPAPEPKIDDVVRIDDKSLPRAAQRLIIGRVTDVQKGVAGRIIVTVRPTLELERLGEVVLLMSPASEPADGGVPGGGGGAP